MSIDCFITNKGETKMKSTKQRSTALCWVKRLSPLAIKMLRIYTLVASFDHEWIPKFLSNISHFCNFVKKTIMIPILPRDFVKF